MRPAPVRVLTTKVAAPPAHTRGVVEPTLAQSAPSTPAVGQGTPRPERSSAKVAATPVRRSGETARGFRWTVLGVIAVSLVVGGFLARLITADDAEHATTTPTTAAPSSTTPSTAPPTTAVATTTAAPVTNAMGLVVGTPAAADSTRVEERFAAHLGVDDTQATPLTPAAVYASWWKLFIGARPGAEASASGFAVTDGGGQTVDLSAFTTGTDGNVADLVECAASASAGPTCNRLSNVISLDVAQPEVGTSDKVTFRRLGEMRLLRDRVVRFVSMTATQPVTAATSPAGDVRFDDHVLAVAVPSGAVPPTIDVTLIYADGTTETVTVTV